MILSQKLRLIWIDACLDQDLGLNRSDVASAFDISIAQASLDFREYISRWPDRIRYDKGRKAYYRAGSEPAFNYDTKRAVLIGLRAVKAADTIRALRAALTEAEARTGRMCVNCGMIANASHPRGDPGKDCPSPDACTFDLTLEEAVDYWRKKAHEAEAALADAREKALREAVQIIEEQRLGPMSATTWGTPKPTIGRLNKMDNDLTTPSAWLPIAMALGIVAWAYILGVV